MAKKATLAMIRAFSGPPALAERVEHRRQREADDRQQRHRRSAPAAPRRRRGSPCRTGAAISGLPPSQQDEDRDHRDRARRAPRRAASASTASCRGPSARPRGRRPWRAGRRASGRCRRGSRRSGKGRAGRAEQAADGEPRDRPPHRLDPDGEVDLDREPPRAGQRGRLEASGGCRHGARAAAARARRGTTGTGRRRGR